MAGYCCSYNHFFAELQMMPLPRNSDLYCLYVGRSHDLQTRKYLGAEAWKWLMMRWMSIVCFHETRE